MQRRTFSDQSSFIYHLLVWIATRPFGTPPSVWRPASLHFARASVRKGDPPYPKPSPDIRTPIDIWGGLGGGRY